MDRALVLFFGQMIRVMTVNKINKKREVYVMYKFILYTLLIILIVFQYIKYEEWFFKNNGRAVMVKDHSTKWALLVTSVIVFEVFLFGSIIFLY